MSQENGHHHHDQTPNPDKAAEGNVLKDPVCGMDVGKDSLHHTEYGGGKIYFCSEHCLTKFQENPSATVQNMNNLQRVMNRKPMPPKKRLIFTPVPCTRK